MSGSKVLNRLKLARDRAGRSQQALAAQIGTSRQAVGAIEAGRQVPSTALALRLARALGCRVDDLFRLPAPDGLDARLAPPWPPENPGPRPERVALGRVREQWVAHGIPSHVPLAADGLMTGRSEDNTCSVRPLADPTDLADNVLVAGCAPLLGTLARRLELRARSGCARWISANSRRALDLLDENLVHLAGLHLFDAPSGQHNVPAIRARFPGQPMLIVNLTRWRQGLVVASGNPLQIDTAMDLLRPDIRVVARESGSGTARLVRRLLGSNAPASGMIAGGHHQVAQLVGHGAADVGVAIESAAAAAGLDFIPLAEERFDLVVGPDLAGLPSVRRFLDALDDPAFRAEMGALPGYDPSQCGTVTTLDAENGARP